MSTPGATELRTITFVAGDDTPAHDRQYAGSTITIPAHMPLPAPGSEGMLGGQPGVLLDGDRWEMRPVDMRDQATKWLDEADELLEQAPGETHEAVACRHAEAQRLILKAMSARVRAMKVNG